MPYLEWCIKSDTLPITTESNVQIIQFCHKIHIVICRDVWGYRNAGLETIDEVILRYCRRILNVKATSSNIIVHEEYGMIPPNVQCAISVLGFIKGLHHMPANNLVKQLYDELNRLHSGGDMGHTSERAGR